MPIRPVCILRWLAVAIVVVVVAGSQTTYAATYYVDNIVGSDAYDGVAETPESATTGPTRSIGRAVKRARSGDRIIVRNTGVPYYESLSLVGNRQSGLENFPFVIESKGAVVDGSREVPSTAWQNAGGDVWRIKPWRKGYYQLLLNGKAVPGTITPKSATKLPAIAVGQWTAWKGSIYYRSAPLTSPLDQPFRFAYHRVGLSLYSVRRVRITGLTFRGFQLDGVNAHDLCERITLDSVNAEANGRAGIAVGGTSVVDLLNCGFNNNRRYSALVTELGGIKVVESKFDKPPTLPKP